MAFKLADRVKETTTSTGTGNLVRAGAVVNFRTFDGAGMVNGDTSDVAIVHKTAAEWEVCRVTMTGGNLVRSTPDASSNGGAAVNFSAGVKDVYMVLKAAEIALLMAGGGGGAVTSVAGRVGVVTLAVADVTGAAPLASPALTGTPTVPTPANSDDSTKIASTAFVRTLRNIANGVAGLDGSGLILNAQLPALAITDVFAVASQAAMLALTAEKGDIAIRSDINRSFALSTSSPGTLADWLEIQSPTAAIVSVAGRVGVIVLGVADVTGAAPLANPVFTGVVEVARLIMNAGAVADIAATSGGFASGQNGQWANFTANTAVAYNLPNGLGKGYSLVVAQTGLGPVTITPTGGTLINGTTDPIVTSQQNGVITLFAIGADNFLAVGVLNSKIIADRFVTTDANNITVAGTTHTLTQAMDGKRGLYTSSAAVAISVPTGLTNTFTYSARQLGTGQLTVAGTGGATANGPNGLKSRARYSPIEIEADGLGTNGFLVLGDTAL